MEIIVFIFAVNLCNHAFCCKLICACFAIKYGIILIVNNLLLSLTHEHFSTVLKGTLHFAVNNITNHLMCVK